MKRTLAILAVVVLASCGREDLSGSGDSGIEGIVYIGPSCPVVQEGSPCPDRTFAATVEIVRDGEVVGSFSTGEDGAFRVPLEPGTYVLQGVSPDEGGLPFAKPVDVTVEPGSFTHVDVLFDSGIR